MSTTLKAEELAKRRYPLASAATNLSQRAIQRLEEFDEKAEHSREAYAEAIREAAQLLASQIDEYRAMLERAIRVMERTANDTLDGRNTAIDARELLYKYSNP